jgi:hypothetical protein
MVAILGSSADSIVESRHLRGADAYRTGRQHVSPPGVHPPFAGFQVSRRRA